MSSLVDSFFAAELYRVYGVKQRPRLISTPQAFPSADGNMLTNIHHYEQNGESSTGTEIDRDTVKVGENERHKE